MKLFSKKSHMLVLQGVPASGKSTFAEEFHKKNPSYVIVNRDSIRRARGEYWIPEQEDYISDIEDYSVRAAISRGLNVIIDATNLNPKTISKWKKMADELNAKIEFKEFKVSYKEALERDKKREHPVGEETIKRFFKMYYPDEIYPKADERRISEFIPELEYAVLCDLDGTVALRNGRSPFEYKKVGEDTFDPRMYELLSCLALKYRIIFFSGRESTPDCVEETKKWLDANVDFPYELYMRDLGDRRSDAVTKKEMYEHYIKSKYNVVCVFEDRDRVVKMWRDMGILCNQVYFGDF